MKKVFVILLAVLAIISSASCSRKIEKPDVNYVVPIETESFVTEEEPQSESFTLPSESESVSESAVTETQREKVDIEWKTITDTYTDSDGYSYLITYKISPWILLSNTDIINDAWNVVGKNNKLPGFNDWGLKLYDNKYMKSVPNGNSSTTFYYPMNDMYYCMGTVSVRNTTSGWNITPENSRTLNSGLNYSLLVSGRTEKYEINATFGTFSVGRVFYSNSTADEADCVGIKPNMTSDNWGPVSFIIMAPENFSPNYPEGRFYEYVKNGVFHTSNMAMAFGGFTEISAYNRNKDSYGFEYFNNGIIGKDRVYAVPDN